MGWIMTIDTTSDQEVKRTLKKVRKAKEEFNNDYEEINTLTDAEKEILRKENRERLEDLADELENIEISEDKNYEDIVFVEEEDDVDERDFHNLLKGKI